MSFINLGANGASKPTFFELVAADRLTPSIRDALVYSLSVLAQRHPALHRLLKFENELVAVVLLILEAASLHASDASFAESLYGLQRRGRTPCSSGSLTAQPAAAEEGSLAGVAGAPAGDGSPSRLPGRARAASLLFLVAVPYLQHRLASAFDRAAAAGNGAQGLRPATAEGRAVHWSGSWRRLAAALRKAFVTAYPSLLAAWEGAVLAHQLLYLLDRSPFYSPCLRAAGLELVRRTDEAARLQLRRRRRQQQLACIAASSSIPEPLRLAIPLLLRPAWWTVDNLSTAVLAAIFAFQALEWWYVEAEPKIAASRRLPPPPPPPPPAIHPAGCGLPSDAKLCPLCRNPRQIPTQIPSSGFAFCYSCAHSFVKQHGFCPVTRIPATLASLRRLHR